MKIKKNVFLAVVCVAVVMVVACGGKDGLDLSKFNSYRASEYMGFQAGFEIATPATSEEIDAVKGEWVSGEKTENLEGREFKYKVGVKIDGAYIYFYMFYPFDLFDDPEWFKSPIDYDKNDEPVFGGVKFSAGKDSSDKSIVVIKDSEGDMGAYYALENDKLIITGSIEGAGVSFEFEKKDDGFFDAAKEGDGGVVIAHGYPFGNCATSLGVSAWTNITATGPKAENDLKVKVFFTDKIISPWGDIFHYIFSFGEEGFVIYRLDEKDEDGVKSYELHDFDENHLTYKLGVNGSDSILLIPVEIKSNDSPETKYLVDCGVYYRIGSDGRLTLSEKDYGGKITLEKQTVENFLKLSLPGGSGWPRTPTVEDVANFLNGDDLT